MFRWFETRIEAFPDEPPGAAAGDAAGILRPLHQAGLAGVRRAAGGGLSRLADRGGAAGLRRQPGRHDEGCRVAASLPRPTTGGILLWMAFVALVARPVVSTAHDLIKNQIIAGPVANRVRWLTHRYVLRQSLGFFQNDFAGRVANKIMQAAPALRDSVVQLIDAIWYAAVQWVGAAVDLRRRRLAPAAAAGRLARGLHRRAPLSSCRASRSARRRPPRPAPCWSGASSTATPTSSPSSCSPTPTARTPTPATRWRSRWSKWQASLRLQTPMELVLYTLNGFLIVSATGARHLAVERRR